MTDIYVTDMRPICDRASLRFSLPRHEPAAVALGWVLLGSDAPAVEQAVHGFLEGSLA